MKPFCAVKDSVAKIAVEMAPMLIKLGVGRIYARATAVRWLARECGMPVILAEPLYNCLMDFHNICSLENKICDIDAEQCNKWRIVDPL